MDIWTQQHPLFYIIPVLIMVLIGLVLKFSNKEKDRSQSVYLPKKLYWSFWVGGIPAGINALGWASKDKCNIWPIQLPLMAPGAYFVGGIFAYVGAALVYAANQSRKSGRWYKSIFQMIIFLFFFWMWLKLLTVSYASSTCNT